MPRATTHRDRAMTQVESNRRLCSAAATAFAYAADATQATAPTDAGRQGTEHRAYRFNEWELNMLTRRLKSAAGETITLTDGEFSLLRRSCAPRSACQPAISCSPRAGSTTMSTTERSTFRS
jgi:DNA-binding response OmpR family regulator